MPTIPVKISDELLDRLRMFMTTNGDNINNDQMNQHINQFILSALEEWTAWMEGSIRPMSISELETHRIFAIYNRVFINELPSADHLGKLFKLPMGRSRYIAQSLAYRYGELLSERRRMAIVHALQQGRWSDSREICVVLLDPTCQSMMDRTMRGLRAEGQLTTVVRGVVTMDGVRYDFGTNHHEVLTNEFNNSLNSIQRGT